jgi:hypothetical protein
MRTIDCFLITILLFSLFFLFGNHYHLSLYPPDLLTNMVRLSKDAKSDELVIVLSRLVESKDRQIEKLNLQLASQSMDREMDKFKDSHVNVSSYSSFIPNSDLERQCELRFGLSLVGAWRQIKQSWCQSSSSQMPRVELRCYPYHQEHKKLDGRGPDNFCVATNFVVDFSKVL